MRRSVIFVFSLSILVTASALLSGCTSTEPDSAAAEESQNRTLDEMEAKSAYAKRMNALVASKDYRDAYHVWDVDSVMRFRVAHPEIATGDDSLRVALGRSESLSNEFHDFRISSWEKSNNPEVRRYETLWDIDVRAREIAKEKLRPTLKLKAGETKAETNKRWSDEFMRMVVSERDRLLAEADAKK